MPFLIGLALIVAALIWADTKLKSYGVTWSMLAAGLVGLVVLNRLAKHVLRRRAATQTAAPAPIRAAPPARDQTPNLPPPAPPSAKTFRGGHVLASGLDARLFLRYRDAAGAVVDCIFELYQVRAFGKGERIAQLHGHCFTANAFRVIPTRDVLAIGDERTGALVPDLDAFLLGTPARLARTDAPRLAQRNPADLRGTDAPPPAGARFLLRYLGPSGPPSDRIVLVKSMALSDDGAILSLRTHCERAGAQRNFLRERIAGLGDAETGLLHHDIDATLAASGVPMRQPRAAAPPAGFSVEITVVGPPGDGPPFAGSPAMVLQRQALAEARQSFAAMSPAERLASARRPAEPKPPKEKRPTGRPRKDAPPRIE